ncbi:NUDIX domain-containing protein [Bdellovibrio sp. HCB337]|uniref:NUDIX domain-containing protein n=1 Tax=Bdellovibrio sp. HCB337 TaxID=3394358 RepID=UPI0039A6577D
MANPIRVSASALIIRDEKLLLIKFNDLSGVHYNLPGGGVDAGESLVAAVARECREEACAEVDVRDLVLSWQYVPELEDFKYGTTQKLGLIFKADLKPGCEPRLPENPDKAQVGVEWVPLKEISEKGTDFPLLPQIQSALETTLSENKNIHFLERSSPMEWSEYFKKFKDRPPRPLLLNSLKSMKPKEKTALELGSGPGRDALHLLQEGWKLTVVEPETSGIEMIQKELPPHQAENFSVIASTFEDLKELPQVDFIYASFSLPFCKPEAFPKFWSLVEKSFKPEAYFAGNFFGPQDEWVQRGNTTGHSEEQVRELFKDFNILSWHEMNERGPTAAGIVKHWHVFTVLAQKKS